MARSAVNSPSMYGLGYLAIMLLALVAVTAVLGSSKLRGAISLFLGLAIGLVGIDFLTGQRGRHGALHHGVAGV